MNIGTRSILALALCLSLGAGQALAIGGGDSESHGGKNYGPAAGAEPVLEYSCFGFHSVRTLRVHPSLSISRLSECSTCLYPKHSREFH